MQSSQNPFLSMLGLSWIGSLATWLLLHFGSVLSAACGIATLIATYFSIRASRIEIKWRKKQLEQPVKHRGSYMPLIACLALLASLFFAGCASDKANWLDRTLFNVTTNYTPHVIVQTQTVVQTNFVPVVVEHTNTVLITNALGAAVVQTNVVFQTNLQTILTVQTNVYSVTSNIPRIELSEKAGTDDTLRAVGGAAGGLFGFGGIASAVLVGLSHIYQSARNKKINAALVQGIETGREILKTTPQGEALDAKYAAWLVSHQSAAGVIGAVSGLVNTFVDNDAAKDAASLIAPPIKAQA